MIRTTKAKILKRTGRIKIGTAKEPDPIRAQAKALVKDLAKEQKVVERKVIPKEEKGVKEEGDRKAPRPEQQPRPRPRLHLRPSRRETIRFQTASRSPQGRSTNAKAASVRFMRGTN